MKNVAVIFAGGTGTRMGVKDVPKQFLEVGGKPIIIYTLEYFQNHPEIDEIYVVCIEPWIDYLKFQLEKYGMSKVVSVVPGGKTGQDSIYIGLKEGVDEDSKYEVLEKTINENGRTEYKRVGIIRPKAGKIWDNRFMATDDGSENSDLQYTTFEKVSGSDFVPGMLIREIR